MPMFRRAHFLRRPFGCLILSAVLAVPPPARGHGDDQLLIDALTQELAKTRQAGLFIRRGELFRHLRQWENAQADYGAAAQLEPGLVIVDFFRARARLESGEPGSARPLIERYLSHVPGEADAWFLRGEVMAALGEPGAGAACYTEGIRVAPEPRPENFLRRAQLIALGAPADFPSVLAALDEGIAQLGPVISLVEYAIDLELARGAHEDALRRIARAMAHAPRREAWLVRQGDTLVQSGRPADAIDAYRSALAAIDGLPPRYRETAPVEKLARDAQQAIERLAAAETPPGRTRHPTLDAHSN